MAVKEELVSLSNHRTTPSCVCQSIDITSNHQPPSFPRTKSCGTAFTPVCVHSPLQSCQTTAMALLVLHDRSWHERMSEARIYHCRQDTTERLCLNRCNTVRAVSHDCARLIDRLFPAAIAPLVDVVVVVPFLVKVQCPLAPDWNSKCRFEII
jgi:hypothetical protein